LPVKTPVYLDHHATTPIDPRVLEVLQRVQRDQFGNPASSGHAFGWAAAKLVDTAREQVAALLGAGAREIIFTSGATESNNLALLGCAEAYAARGRHLVTTNLEHEAVELPLAHLAQGGWRVSTVAAGTDGLMIPEAISSALTADTVLVSMIAAQNEIGTIQPLAEVGRICKDRGVILHTDAAQAAGRIPLDVDALGVDLLSLSGHKIYGPKGVGALYVRRRNPRVSLIPRQQGGGQERGLRSGTLNVPGIVALGEACRIAAHELTDESRRLLELRDRFWHRLREGLSGVHLNGAEKPRLAGNLNVSFEGVGSRKLLTQLTQLAVSTGSACSSADAGPSTILQRIGLTPEMAGASLRIGLGRFTTVQEVDFAANRIVAVVASLRDGGTEAE